MNVSSEATLQEEKKVEVWGIHIIIFVWCAWQKLPCGGFVHSHRYRSVVAVVSSDQLQHVVAYC